MRYWVYHESRLLGPLAKEDLSSVSGIHGDSLVCEEGSAGVADKDWKTVASIPELSGLGASASSAGSPLLTAEAGFDSFQRLAHESLDKLGISSPGLTSVFDDARWLDPLGDLSGLVDPDDQMQADRSHVLELEDRLLQLKGQLEKYETRQDEILGRLGEKDRLLTDRERELEALRERLAALETRDQSAVEAPPRPAPKTPAPAPEAPEKPPPAKEPPLAAAAPLAPPKLEIVPFADAMEEAPAKPRKDADASKLMSSPGVADGVAEVRDGILRLPASPVEDSAKAGTPDVAPPPLEDAVQVELPDLTPPSEVQAGASHARVDAPLPVVESAPAGGMESLELRSTSDMPQGMDFVPPMPEESASGPVSAPVAMDMPPPSILEAPPAMAEEPPPEVVESASAMEISVGQPHTMIIGMGGMPESPESQPPDMIPLTAPPREVGMPWGPAQAQDPSANMALTPPPMPAGEGGAWSGLAQGQVPGQFPGQVPTPMPIPLGGTTPFPSGPATPMPTMGQPDLPETVMAGLGVAQTNTPTPGQTWPGPDIGGQSFEDLMGKPPTVSPTSPSSPRVTQVPALTSSPSSVTAESGKEPKKGLASKKKFIIITLVAFVALILILVFFFRNPKQVSKMVDMAPEEKPQGVMDVNQPGVAQQPGESAQGEGTFFAQRPQSGAQAPVQPEAEPPSAEPAVEPPPAAPPRGRDYIPDQRIEAMEFVKGHVLDTERGTIEQWLEYAFLSPGHTPEWTAGAVDAETWLVEYNIFQGARSKKPRMTYRFEVNLAKNTLVGRNPEAKDLLSGGMAKTESRKPVKKAARPPFKARKTPSRTIAHGRPSGSGQDPLPEEEELDNASGQSAPQFNNPAGE